MHEPAEVRELIRREVSWGATPLAITGREDIARNQREVFDILNSRIVEQAPDNTPEVLRRFIEMNFMHRFYQRMMRNQASYNDRLFVFDDQPAGIKTVLLDDDSDEAHGDVLAFEFKDVHSGLEAYEAGLPTFDDVFEGRPELRDMYLDVLRGIGSAREALLVREALGMRSIELTRLTHPYGHMIEDLEGMRAEVSEAILALDGELFDEPPTEYKINSSDNIADPSQDHAQAGLSITRKRYIGQLPDGTDIYERSSFVLRIDENSPFNQDYAQAIRSIKYESTDTWSTAVWQAGRLAEELPRLLAENDFACILPMSTTIYAHNPVDDAAIERRKGRQTAERKQRFSAEFPLIREWQEQQRALGGQALHSTSRLGI